MLATVQFQLPDGSTHEVGPGGIVGRGWSAALQVDDPRVSEAHALVSLRGATLKLLALRGRFLLDGRMHTEADLRPGQRITLAQGLDMVVVAVHLPDEVLSVQAEGLPRQVLHGTTALLAGPPPRLVSPGTRGAIATFWQGPKGWRWRDAHGNDSDVEEDAPLTVQGLTLHLARVPLEQGSADATGLEGRVAEPLKLLARYETVHLFRGDNLVGVVDGIGARLLSELVSFGVPVHWRMLAEQVWPEGADRKRFDACMIRLRRRLRDLGVRTNLVRPNGRGQYELLLLEGDRVESQL